MLAELADRAGAESIATSSRITAAVPAEQFLQALLRAYLSKEHAKNPEVGCPIAALGTEMPLQPTALSSLPALARRHKIR